MALINASFFQGNLIIAQLNQKAVTDSLTWYIETYEPEFLVKVLGLELYEGFIAGLAAVSVDSKWLFIRDGGNFIGQNTYLKKWVGMAVGSTFNPNVAPDSEIVIPITGFENTNSITFSPLAGAKYYVERRGFGTMIEGTDVLITNDRQTLTLLKAGDLFLDGEVLIAHVTKAGAGITAAGNYSSPIAAYVYYHYMRDLVTSSAGIGEVKATAQNAMISSAAQKMADAWNVMSNQLKGLYEYLNINNDIFPGWNYGATAELNSASCYNNFRPINTIGI